MDANLCLERWTQNYYMKHERVFQNQKEQPEPSVEITVKNVPQIRKQPSLTDANQK